MRESKGRDCEKVTRSMLLQGNESSGNKSDPHRPDNEASNHITRIDFRTTPWKTQTNYGN